MRPKPKEPPIINAPWPVTVFALMLVVVHLIRILMPNGWQNVAFYYGALMPERFWAPTDGIAANGLPGYPNAFEAFIPMLASGFLHADWMHVGLNAAFLIALAKPLLELFRRVWPGREPGASLLLLGMFIAAQIASSGLYLAMNYPDGPAAVGASGGISGLLAGVLLLRFGPDRWLLAQGFLVASAAFVGVNIALAFVGPSLVGSGIAWQAHIGGYIGGALFMRAVLWRMQTGRA